MNYAKLDKSERLKRAFKNETMNPITQFLAAKARERIYLNASVKHRMNCTRCRTWPDLCETGQASLEAQLRAVEMRKSLETDNACRYPGCVENDDERCPDWLTGSCPGPK